jgi:hypothetical protein
MLFEFTDKKMNVNDLKPVVFVLAKHKQALKLETQNKMSILTGKYQNRILRQTINL